MAKKTSYRYSLAIAAIFRDEAPYLKEWIEFHREVGCEHFYLFDNLSVDNCREVLGPYIDAGIVELFSWPIEHYGNDDWDELQCLAYERALHFARGHVKWLAFLDTDEFLFSVKEDHLGDTLAKYEKFGGVAVNWQIFGTSSVSKIPEDRLLIETLFRKLVETAPMNHKIKSIVRPDRIESCPSPHYMAYKPGFFQVNSDCVRFEGRTAPYVQIDTLRINHYKVRDEYFLTSQKLPRVQKWWNSQPAGAWRAMFDRFNEVPDQVIFRFIPRLKERMQKSAQNPLIAT